MTNLTNLRDVGSLIAGLLIGPSLVVTVFAMTFADTSARQTVWVIVAPIVFAFGLVLQLVITRPTRPPQRRTNDRELAASQ